MIPVFDHQIRRVKTNNLKSEIKECSRLDPTYFFAIADTFRL